MNDLAAEVLQQKALEWAIDLAKTQQSTPYEHQLLAHHREGLLPAEQLLELLDTRVQHVLYCSQAVQPFSEDQLADLLEQARTYNERYHITGLLCYEQAHFVQVLEGPIGEVMRLMARIEGDRRHHHLRILHCGAGPVHRFPNWRMTFAKPHTDEFYWLISHIEAYRHRLLLPQVPVPELSLPPLLHAFGQVCSGKKPTA